ncbi:uncharacterized protein TNCV_3929761 [Trichonephila clavipes]|nr:uncharacterized protein TNCV_3929761 [Trichonephila clavipes]
MVATLLFQNLLPSSKKVSVPLVSETLSCVERKKLTECSGDCCTHKFKSRVRCGSPVVEVSDHGWHVMSSSPVPLKTRRVGQRCKLNLSRAETSSRWCGVVVRRGRCHLKCHPRHLTMAQNYMVRRQKPSCS